MFLRRRLQKDAACSLILLPPSRESRRSMKFYEAVQQSTCETASNKTQMEIQVAVSSPRI